MTPPETPAAAPHHHAHTWEEARQAAIDAAVPIPPGPVPLRQALGRELAEDVTALQDMPHYASSAMDGWAVNGSGPWIPVERGQRLAPHQASPIATGGLVPPGAKAVLRSESAELGTDEDGLPVLKLGGSARPGEPRNGQHIRKAGEEAAAGEVLIKAGVTINPAHIALAAVAGYDELVVKGKAVVKLLLTGSEVVESGLPVPGRVRDTFGPQLADVVSMIGGVRGESLRIGDGYEEWLGALEDSPGEQPADVVITTGGTGRSDTDHLRRAVKELGGRLVVDGIAMRPGHPAVLAELPDGRLVLGLPGNPLAAMMALCTVGWPLLAALGDGRPMTVRDVPCGTIMEPQLGYTRLLPFRMLYGMASPVQHTGPGMMRGLAAADGVMVVPPHGVQLGEPVPAFALPWTPDLPALEDAKAKEKPAARKPRRGTAAKSSGPVDWSALIG
ncbi:molybdopterin molybdotransferase MoeA [Pseudarthrobacter sp. J75]|uniref:molybdopterin molybdotransferase MoeA n=1 Tax=unclassified Pseudarthrobacter TaxID=2647000 RepID=UPI002E80B34E|nr:MULTISPECIES: molybdopterin molybdotransferase MoeA [unclassified Pseudarthrobacter]MEE2523211.1 molybdopterin molybdotransferase MoeA [Pseudarthrobacter sp. J47]MEE2527466.1 molybdopterin molybdotransferase MoeA [Pseudarthrobacter sp. J75]